MKQRELLRHIERAGAVVAREGRRHIIYYNPANNKTSAVPRHTEINNYLAAKICRDLGIPEP